MPKEYIKAITTTLLRLVLRIFHLLPLKKKRIVFESFNGKQIACNPFYIYQYLKKKHPEYTYIWCYNFKSPDNDITCIRKNSFLYIYNLLTSSTFITNDSIPQYIPFRKRQTVINTWHGGGAYKKVGTELERCNWYYRLNLKRTSRSTTYFLSSSEKFTEAAPKAFLVPSFKVLSCGMPRNDIFFNEELKQKANKKVRDFYNISDDCFIVLYAPTFRDTNFIPQPDFRLIKKTIEERFKAKQTYFLLRAHHRMLSFYTQNSKNFCIDASQYPYMQELLCAADMLISDYSSCIWDYSFTYRPCLLFVPDLQQYKSDRDFHTPIDTWGFPIAETNERLSYIILNFDELLFKRNMTKHHSNLNSYEKGNATSFISELISTRINQTNQNKYTHLF